MKSPDPHTPAILIADDQADVLEALRFLTKGEGYQSEAVTSPAAALDAIESRDFDAVLMDLNYTRDTTSGQEGLDLLNRIQTLDGNLPVIVMTAWGSVELAVEAMRRGARDFIQKPWDNARLSAILKTQIELGRALRKGQRLEAENRALRAERFPQLIGGSAAGARRDFARGPLGCQRHDHRRERHRQRPGGANTAFSIAAFHAPAG